MVKLRNCCVFLFYVISTSEMTYIVSGGALNYTHSLFCYGIFLLYFIKHIIVIINSFRCVNNVSTQKYVGSMSSKLS